MQQPNQTQPNPTKPNQTQNREPYKKYVQEVHFWRHCKQLNVVEIGKILPLSHSEINYLLAEKIDNKLMSKFLKWRSPLMNGGAYLGHKNEMIEAQERKNYTWKQVKKEAPKKILLNEKNISTLQRSEANN